MNVPSKEIAVVAVMPIGCCGCRFGTSAPLGTRQLKIGLLVISMKNHFTLSKGEVHLKQSK